MLARSAAPARSKETGDGCPAPWLPDIPSGMTSDVRYRLAIFDFDGTLADSLPWLRRAFADLAAELGFRNPDDGELEVLRRSAPREALALLGIPGWRMPLVAARLRRRMAAEPEAIRLFPGVHEALRRLHEADVRLAMVSSNARGNVERVLGAETAARISWWACGSSMFGKAAHFRRVLARSGVRSEEAICVGDEIRDAEAAREVGVAFGAVGWGYHTLEALRARGPAEVFEQVEELARLAG